MADEAQVNQDGVDKSDDGDENADSASSDGAESESVPSSGAASDARAAQRKSFDPDRVYCRTHSPDLTVCPNCGRKLVGQYCARCGQNNRIHRLYFRSMVVAFIQEAFEIEGPLVRTFGKMWTKPGEVCRDYIEGRRRRYMSPVRYFLMSSIVYVLAVSITGVDQTEGVRSVMPDPSTGNVTVRIDKSDDATEEELAVADSRRQRLRRNLAYFMSPEGQQAFREDTEEKGPTIQLILSPFLAAFLLILYYDKRMCFAEHLVFLLYTKSQLTIVTVVAMVLGLYSTLTSSLVLMLALPVLYSSWAAMRFYREHAVLAVLRQTAALLVLIIMSGVTGGAMAVATILLKDAPAHFEWEPPSSGVEDASAETDGAVVDEAGVSEPSDN